MIIAAIFIVAIGLVLYNLNRKPDYTLKEYPVDKLPTFTFNIAVPQNGTTEITKESLKEKSIKAYEFAKDIDNDWETVTNDYIGIRLKDILEAYNLDYESIEFYESDKYSVKYRKDDINDDVYVVFYRDGKSLGDTEPTALVSFKDKWHRSLTDFNYMFVYQKVTEPPKSDGDIDESDINAP